LQAWIFLAEDYVENVAALEASWEKFSNKICSKFAVKN
jgi:hypothetical protein